LYISDSLLDELVGAGETLSTESPDALDAVTAELLETGWYTVTYLLLRAWSANAARFGSKCIRFVTADRRRLDIGYGAWSDEGSRDAAISRAAILACLPYARGC
jgi:hypothetical protein